MNICKPCEKFESGVNQWKYIHGFADPLPYISEMIKSHEQLLFEERRIDGVNPSILLYRCLKCGQSWELLSWEAIGQLDIQPHFPRYNSSTQQGFSFCGCPWELELVLRGFLFTSHLTIFKIVSNIFRIMIVQSINQHEEIKGGHMKDTIIDFILLIFFTSCIIISFIFSVKAIPF